jgi:hypothetical protein
MNSFSNCIELNLIVAAVVFIAVFVFNDQQHCGPNQGSADIPCGIQRLPQQPERKQSRENRLTSINQVRRGSRNAGLPVALCIYLAG